MKKIKNKIKKIIQFIANPRLLLCFGIAWIITNGWSYALLGIGTYYSIGWMIAIASGFKNNISETFLKKLSNNLRV